MGLRFKSKKPHNITNRTSYVIENRIVAVRKATALPRNTCTPRALGQKASDHLLAPDLSIPLCKRLVRDFLEGRSSWMK